MRLRTGRVDVNTVLRTVDQLVDAQLDPDLSFAMCQYILGVLEVFYNLWVVCRPIDGLHNHELLLR